MLGKTIEPSPHTLKPQLQKITAERRGSFLATKMHPSLPAEVSVSHNTSWVHTVGFGEGGEA